MLRQVNQGNVIINAFVHQKELWWRRKNGSPIAAHGNAANIFLKLVGEIIRFGQIINYIFDSNAEIVRNTCFDRINKFQDSPIIMDTHSFHLIRSVHASLHALLIVSLFGSLSVCVSVSVCVVSMCAGND